HVIHGKSVISGQFWSRCCLILQIYGAFDGKLMYPGFVKSISQSGKCSTDICCYETGLILPVAVIISIDLKTKFQKSLIGIPLAGMNDDFIADHTQRRCLNFPLLIVIYVD